MDRKWRNFATDSSTLKSKVKVKSKPKVKALGRSTHLYFLSV